MFACRSCTAVAATVLVGGGCGEGPSPSSAAATTEVDSAGVRIVESFAPAWPNSPRYLERQPILELGGEEPGPELFSSVVRAIFLADGRILVSDAVAQEIRVFSATGDHLLTLGGAGEGPGEFGGPATPFRYRGDSVAVFDHRLRRTTVFSLTSGEGRTVPNPMEGNFVVFGSTATGGFLYFNPGSGYRPDLPAGLQWDTTDVYLVEPDGSARIVSRRASRQQLVLPGGNTDFLAPAHRSIKVAAEHGFYWGTSDRYEIRFYSLEGVLRQIIRRPVDPTPVDDSMIQQYIEVLLERTRRFEGEEAVAPYRRRYEAGTYGDYVPLFAQAFLDREQRLWVSEGTWPRMDGTPRAWSVFSAEGRWLGDVASPNRLRILDSVGNQVLGVWRDDFDVPRVRVHRLLQ